MSDLEPSGPAQGWYKDPTGVHDARYFSHGVATNLFKDGLVEGYDEAPGDIQTFGLVPWEPESVNAGEQPSQWADGQPWFVFAIAGMVITALAGGGGVRGLIAIGAIICAVVGIGSAQVSPNGVLGR